MSHLWPETISVGLFADQCWLRRGRTLSLADGHGQAAAPERLLSSLTELLAGQPQAALKRARLHVLVADSAAAITVLPWQEALSGADEWRAYAHACFERQGQALDDGWALQTGFRHFRGAGLAYAMPQAWLGELLEVAGRAGLRLASVLPVSAAAYWRHGGTPGAAPDLLLLAEAHRITGQLWARGRLLGVDVQPVIGGVHATGARLLRRMSALQPNIGSVQWWSSAVGGEEPPLAFIGETLAEARLVRLAREVWS
ncbi:hypothetical protein ACFOLJ_22465 [Rugamonas sp. CCM 8940]|uniref:hypothetical protein n=1 Tax=Rugamonas sp. CCM 8940 TaxID=2765359 RepID=UPI0018F55565|nr:hypothetical protein [Rugamonas sp. CCM 8940]MBJ7311488.1 hypothetical protein [Rugamonas sp. CCM 8940]